MNACGQPCKWLSFLGLFGILIKMCIIYTFILKNVYAVCIINLKGGNMKQRDLVKKLKTAGFHHVRHGGDHDVYHRGNDEEVLPRHKEVNERLAKAILRKW